MPLSAFALVLGLILLGIAVVASITGAPGPLIGWLGVVGAVMIVGTIFERVRYKALAPRPPGADWTATEERFRDPATGRWVQVYFKPATGERRYVETEPPKQ